MDVTPSGLKFIQYGIAARLRAKPSDIKARYYPSTYVGAPEGIVDESECLMVVWRSHLGPCSYRLVQPRGFDAGFLDEMASGLKQAEDSWRS